MLLRVSEAVERFTAVAAGKLPDVASPPPPTSDFMNIWIIQPCQSWAWVQMQSPSIEARQAALDVVDAALHRAEAHGVTRRAIQLSALRALALDAFAVSGLPSAGHRPRDRSSAGRIEGAPLDELTNREMDVLELLQRRLTNKEIAAHLGISAATVKSHTLGIYGKLGVRGRRQAVSAATDLGILRG